MKRKTTKNSGPCKSLEKKNINEPEDSSENTSPCQIFEKKANKKSGCQQIYCSKKISPLQTPLSPEEIHRAPYRAFENIVNSSTSKALKIKIQMNHELWKYNALIKSCKENFYKSLVLVKRENANAPESSDNSAHPRSFEKKHLLKPAIVEPSKRKIQMQMKSLKTLVLIKVINGKTNKNSGPHKSLEIKNTINQKTELMTDSYSTFKTSTL